MIDNKQILAFIPARSGSKGIPHKNLKKINGKELIGYTIEAALKTEACDKVIVDTDSKQIAEISNRFGAQIPYYRPKHLAKDDSIMMDVISHSIDWFDNNTEYNYDIFLYLQPTSPLRTHEDILSALQLFFEKDANSVISVNKATSLPERMDKLPKNLRMDEFCSNNNLYANRQYFDTYYELNGAIHIAKWDILKEMKSWYVKNSFAFIMDNMHSLDIDQVIDLEFAKFLIEKGYVEI